MAHAAGGCLPERIKDYGPVRPFTGAFDNLGAATRAAVRLHGTVKLAGDGLRAGGEPATGRA